MHYQIGKKIVRRALFFCIAFLSFILLFQNVSGQKSGQALLNYLTNFSDSDQVALDKDLVAASVSILESTGSDFLENNFSSAIPSFAWPFILAVIVFLLSVIDLLFTNVLKLRLISIDLILLSLIAIVYILVFESINLGRSPGYEPDQPIKFSHRVHAGENQINCLYCHSGAVDSRHSTIPATSLCLNCHTVIKNGKNTGTEEIAKIQQAMDNGKSIEWVKVHNLPDYVFFSHAQHVTVGKLDCKECHGDVATMGRVQQINDLSMGWCITCHRTKEVQMSTNDYYQTFTKLHEDFVSGKITKVTVDDIGGNNCAKCHY